MSDGTKYCKGCGYDLPRAMFARQTAAPDGLQYKCRDCKAELDKDWRARNPERCAERHSRYEALRNPQKKKAKDLARNAVRSGKITKLPCCVCGSDKSQAHHEDYSKPLDVIWYCQRHHSARHEELRRIARENGTQ